MLGVCGGLADQASGVTAGDAAGGSALTTASAFISVSRGYLGSGGQTALDDSPDSGDVVSWSGGGVHPLDMVRIFRPGFAGRKTQVEP